MVKHQQPTQIHKKTKKELQRSLSLFCPEFTQTFIPHG